MKQIDIKKLQKELLAAGIESSGCNSKGVVWSIELDQDGFNIEIQDRPDVAAVILAHDHNPDAETVRRLEYAKLGVNPQEMIFALWKKVMDSDSTDADALQSLMDGIDVLIH